MKPTIGRIVIYTSRNGDGIKSPAIVVRTKADTNVDILEKWRPGGVGTLSGAGRPPELVVDLYDDYHIDLAVFGLGGVHYQYNVCQSNVDLAHSWDWPERVG